MKITLSTCFYRFRSKFDPATYTAWAANLFALVQDFALVVYTDEASMNSLPPVPHGARIRVVILPLERFHNYRYRDYWIANHGRNRLLNDRTCWELGMLWAEKTSFVLKTALADPFGTELFGWCDIGYFRGTSRDTPIHRLVGRWPSDAVLERLERDRVHYARVHHDPVVDRCVLQKNEHGLPAVLIPDDQVSFAGGFFLAHRDMVAWWRDTFDARLRLYFVHGRLVKDDQIIIADCILSRPERFRVWTEDVPHLDNWFMFQRKLLADD
jgi:hypothetical protein